MTSPVVDLGPEQRLRALWAGVAWVIAGVLGVLGVGYLIGGISVAANSHSYEVVQRFLPGGMHTHGALMLGIGLCLAYGLMAPMYRLPIRERWSRGCLIGVMAYSAWLVFEFSVSWVLNGTPAVAPVVWWVAALVLSGLLVKLPPPTAHEVRVLAVGDTYGVGRA